jgi:hypothetical protein
MGDPLEPPSVHWLLALAKEHAADLDAGLWSSAVSRVKPTKSFLFVRFANNIEEKYFEYSGIRGS